MPVTIGLDEADWQALAAWLRQQIADDDEPQREAHGEMLALFERHRRAYTDAGKVARRGMKLLGVAYQGQVGYREEWAP